MIVVRVHGRRPCGIGRNIVELSPCRIAMAVVLAPALSCDQTIGRTGTVTQYIQQLVRVVVYIDDTFLGLPA